MLAALPDRRGLDRQAPRRRACSDTLAREEHHFEAGPGRPPAPAIDLLRGYLRQEPVSLAVRLQTVRRTTRLLDAEARPAAEVVDDEVSVLDGRRVVARFRELEAELTQDADEAIIDPVIKRLVAEGAQRAEPALPKYVRALHAAGGRTARGGAAPASGPRPSRR